MLPSAEEPRTTESPLAMPSFRQIGRLLGGALRLKFSNCGAAPVLEHWTAVHAWGAVRTRCSGCQFRYESTAPLYPFS